MENPVQPSAVTRVIVHGVETSEQERPEWREIEQAVLRMDGDLYNQTIMVIRDDHYLLIGGGENGRFVCEAELSDGQYVLTDPSRLDDEVIPIMNGQLTDYVASHVVGLDPVIDAARHFFLTGQLLQSLRWERI
jgi:hypothetical protein